jgi:Trk K+ transport system NAD-binding subunit
VDPLLLIAGAVAEALRPGDQRACLQVDGQAFVVHEGVCEDRRLQRPLRQAAGAAQRPLLVTTMGLHPGRSDRTTAEGQPARRLAGWFRPLITALRWLRQRSGLELGMAVGLVGLLVAGILLFSRTGGWTQGFFVTLALLKGEYVDPVNVVLSQGHGGGGPDPWLIGGTLLYSLVGTMLTSALVAFILEWLLRERFGPARPGRLKRGSHRILLVEGGELGLQVAVSLEGVRRGVVRVDSRSDLPRPARGSVVYERLEAALAALEPCRVEGIGLLSSDLLANLQGALELRRRWPHARLAILAHAVEAAERLGELLGGVAVISTMDLAADAMVATAFGERVEEVCRIDGANLLLVRYRVVDGDTLSGRSVARVEHGYGVTVLQLRRPRLENPLVFPSGDHILAAGDRLAVLGTLADLRSIETGREVPPAWCVRLQGAPQDSCRFDAQQSLARHLGTAPGAMAYLLDGRDHLTPAIDEDIGERLVGELRRLGIRCRLEPASD